VGIAKGLRVLIVPGVTSRGVAVDDDRPTEPAGLLCMQTGRSLLMFKLAFVSVVLVGPELT
jgi:hypothetical protein